MQEELKQRLAKLPASPGVYLMKDGQGRVIYVGKAQNLKKRVSSYFRRMPRRDLKTSILVEKIAAFDTILTHTEKEALILESNLIKKHLPRYNVILRDDKRYPCLRLDLKSPYPALTIARKFQRDGAMYFGPFASAKHVRETLRMINRTFRLRKCRRVVPERRKRPCLNYQMGLCLGMCARPVDPETYSREVKNVILFLKGRMPEVIQEVREQMAAAASREDFETAATYRDRLFALEKTLEKQVVVTSDFMDRDVVGVARQAGAALVTLLFVRGGFLLGNRAFQFEDTLSSDTELVGSFIRQYYDEAPFVPKEILLPVEVEDRALLEERLTELKGEHVSIGVPQRGEKARLVKMAADNAGRDLDERLSTSSTGEVLLGRVQKAMDLRKCPHRIECFDLSAMGGTDAVGAMVVFEGGEPLRSAYRKYRVKGVEGPDDYGMLREVLLKRYGDGDATPLPDLLMVDGGKGQLNIASAVLSELGIVNGMDVIGIAKRDVDRGETADKIYLPERKNPVNLRRSPDVLLFLQRIRDEAHRYVIRYHRKRRLLSYRQSALDAVPGIGPRRRERLLKHFGSLERIKDATLEDLCGVPGMTRAAAQALLEGLHGPKG